MNNEKESEGHVFGRGTIAVFVLEGEKGQRSKIEGSIKWRKSTASVRFTPTSSLHCAVLWASVTELVQAALVTCVRDELGSCGPGSSTAVVLFYIYGAAAGPAVVWCESHDSSAGNRDGPVILAPCRLQVTPALRGLLAPNRSAKQRAPQTHTRRPPTRTNTLWFCSIYGHVRPSVLPASFWVCVPLCPYLIILGCPLT